MTRRYLLLDNVRSLLNVGAIFRTCDAAGFTHVYLTGFTPFPPRKEIAKTALGAEKTVIWEYYENIHEVLDLLQSQNVEIVVCEQTDRSIMLADHIVDPTRDVCLIMGNEIEGVQSSVIDRADVCVEIPMLGMKKSLNVSVAAGVLMYHFV